MNQRRAHRRLHHRQRHPSLATFANRTTIVVAPSITPPRRLRRRALRASNRQSVTTSPVSGSNPNAPYSEALADSVWVARCGLLYKAWVQVRYHRRRQRFFDLADKGTKAVTLLLGASLFGKNLAALPWVATGISGLGLMALVFGYGDRKQLHKELAEQAAGLVALIEGIPAGELRVENTAQWAAEYARLCAKAPPPLKRLTLMCEHEQSLADGHPKQVKKPWIFMRLIAHFKA